MSFSGISVQSSGTCASIDLASAGPAGLVQVRALWRTSSRCVALFVGARSLTISIRNASIEAHNLQEADMIRLNVTALILQLSRTALTILSLLNAPPAFAQVSTTPALDEHAALHARGMLTAPPVTRPLRP